MEGGGHCNRQAGEDDSLVQGGGGGDSEKWSDSGIALKGRICYIGHRAQEEEGC